MHQQPAGSQAELSSWGGSETCGTCSPSCCPSWDCQRALGMAHLCVVLHQGSARHAPPVVAGCHNQCHISPRLCHADRQLNGGLGGWGGGRRVRDAPRVTHGPHTAHAGTHIHSPSQPAAGGPWAEPGARSSPAPAARGVPGRGTPHWSPAPPALKHKHVEGRALAQEQDVHRAADPALSTPHSEMDTRHPSASWARRLLQVPRKALGSPTNGTCGVCAPQMAVPTCTALSTGSAIPYPGTLMCAVHAPCVPNTPCMPPTPETAPHSTASEALIGARSQAVLPCPRLGHTDPFPGTLLALRAQAGQLQPSTARLCRLIQGSRMPGGLGVPIILSPFLAPGHPDRALQPTVCPLLSWSPQP